MKKSGFKRFGGGKARPAPAMNVTPLVDIVLVLLIIFMVVLPSMEQNAAVELPNIFHVDEEPEGRIDPATVSITADRRLFLEQDELPRAELEARCAAAEAAFRAGAGEDPQAAVERAAVAHVAAHEASLLLQQGAVRVDRERTPGRVPAGG